MQKVDADIDMYTANAIMLTRKGEMHTFHGLTQKGVHVQSWV